MQSVVWLTFYNHSLKISVKIFLCISFTITLWLTLFSLFHSCFSSFFHPSPFLSQHYSIFSVLVKICSTVLISVCISMFTVPGTACPWNSLLDIKLSSITNMTAKWISFKWTIHFLAFTGQGYNGGNGLCLQSFFIHPQKDLVSLECQSMHRHVFFFLFRRMLSFENKPENHKEMTIYSSKQLL